MKKSKKYFEVVSLSEAEICVKAETKKLSFSQKIEWTTRLREFAYGKKATTGRVRRVFALAKLGDS